jgi:predicted ATPase
LQPSPSTIADMNFLRSIGFKPSVVLPDGFPFLLPAVESLTELAFDTPVTFLVGENGSGKSTVLEAIAVGMQCPSIGRADANFDDLLLPAKRLAEHLTFSQSRRARRRLFFRAEDAIGFTLRLKSTMAELRDMESHFDETLEGEGRGRAMGSVRGQRMALVSRYGEDPDSRSHGEWFLHMFKERVLENGLYLMDEPETPLSPIHQLSLLSLIRERVKEGCQFIIATHSPILMALPDSTIFSFDSYPVSQIAWEDVEHVAITRAFLNDPESFLRHL